MSSTKHLTESAKTIERLEARVDELEGVIQDTLDNGVSYYRMRKALAKHLPRHRAGRE